MDKLIELLKRLMGRTSSIEEITRPMAKIAAKLEAHAERHHDECARRNKAAYEATRAAEIAAKEAADASALSRKYRAMHAA